VAGCLEGGEEPLHVPSAATASAAVVPSDRGGGEGDDGTLEGGGGFASLLVPRPPPLLLPLLLLLLLLRHLTGVEAKATTVVRVPRAAAVVVWRGAGCHFASLLVP
jgi:hypothetical protein